jgi:hypothetical protein
MKVSSEQVTKLSLSDDDALDSTPVMADDIDEKDFNDRYGNKLPWFLEEQAS